jgi:hypothetical protein
VGLIRSRKASDRFSTKSEHPEASTATDTAFDLEALDFFLSYENAASEEDDPGNALLE